MKKMLVVLNLILLATFVDAKVGDISWKIRMQSMLTDVLTLFPYAYDEDQKLEKKDFAKIKKVFDSLKKNSAELKKHTGHFDLNSGKKIDPSFSFIADSFESEIAIANESFNKNLDFDIKTRSYLRSSIAKCMLCHTQSNNGPQFKLDEFKAQFAKLKPLDRFTAMAATRQFDLAITEFEKMAKDPNGPKQGQAFIDKSARTAMAILVRVKKDPQAAIQLVNTIQNSKNFSKVMTSDLTEWKSALEKWKLEKPSNLSSDQAYFDEAKKLSEKMGSPESEEKSEIDLLRASGILHEMLIQFPESKLRAESLMLLASIYDSLPGFAIWDLSTEYLGSCVLENPHSAIGKKCFDKYEELVTFGYTGSAGVNVPAAVKSQIKRMKNLAEPKK